MIVRWVRIGLTCAMLLLYTTAPAVASCFMNLQYCFYQASLIESFWTRTMAALDCELLFIGCVREVIFG